MKRKDEDVAKSAFLELESVKLSAYFDGELSKREEKILIEKVHGKSDSVETELEEFRFLRREVRNWHQQRLQSEIEKYKPVDVWEAIKDQLEASKQKNYRKSFYTRLLDYYEEIQLSFRRPIAPALSGAVAMLVLFAFAYVSLEEAPRGTESQIVTVNSAVNQQLAAVNSGSRFPSGRHLISSSIDSEQLIANSGRCGSANCGLGSIFGDSSRQAQIPMPEALAVRMITPELLANNQLQGGFRTGGMDIDWIKTDKPFKIVSASNSKRKAPPVIWVARKEASGGSRFN